MMAGFVEKSQNTNLVELFDFVVESSNYKQFTLNDPDGAERWENILELRTVAQQYKDLSPRESLAAFLESVALVSDVDGYDASLDRVTLITLHQAKGLEFPVVFIVGRRKNYCRTSVRLTTRTSWKKSADFSMSGLRGPSSGCTSCTRSAARLWGRTRSIRPRVSWTISPNTLITSPGWQQGHENKVTDAVYAWNRCASMKLLRRRPAANEKPAGLPAFDLKAGDRVRHSIFGEGVVVSNKKVKADNEVTVAFSGQGIKKLLLSLAHLQKI